MKLNSSVETFGFLSKIYTVLDGICALRKRKQERGIKCAGGGDLKGSPICSRKNKKVSFSNFLFLLHQRDFTSK